MGSKLGSSCCTLIRWVTSTTCWEWKPTQLLGSLKIGLGLGWPVAGLLPATLLLVAQDEIEKLDGLPLQIHRLSQLLLIVWACLPSLDTNQSRHALKALLDIGYLVEVNLRLEWRKRSWRQV